MDTEAETRLKETDIYKLNLNEEMKSPDNHRTYIRRVPGGWIYSFQAGEVNVYSSVFVPFNNEFQVNN